MGAHISMNLGTIRLPASELTEHMLQAPRGRNGARFRVKASDYHSGAINLMPSNGLTGAPIRSGAKIT